MKYKDKLLRCCGKFPRYYTKDGVTWVACQTCENRTLGFLSAHVSANKMWNEMRERQLEVEGLYDGQRDWYKKE